MTSSRRSSGISGVGENNARAPRLSLPIPPTPPEPPPSPPEVPPPPPGDFPLPEVPAEASSGAGDVGSVFLTPFGETGIGGASIFFLGVVTVFGRGAGTALGGDNAGCAGFAEALPPPPCNPPTSGGSSTIRA